MSRAKVTHTPQRSFRSPDALWDPAKVVAASNGEDLTKVLNRALAAYVAEGVRTGDNDLKRALRRWTDADADTVDDQPVPEPAGA